ncbi:MAG TPA: hypothetical protein VNV44_02775 [Solirubrobacteraceae bacterium]|jgi:hypothetical protein|nr:hypothetical protein [Solirubrobacteraceae bacterium]
MATQARMEAPPAGAPSRRRELLRWVAGLGAVTAESLAAREGRGEPSARGALGAARQAGHLAGWDPLRELATLYTVTRAGMRAAGLTGIEPARVSAASAAHAAACCSAAVKLERAFPGHAVLGEPAMRAALRAGDAAWTRRSARRGQRPDLLLVPEQGARERPIAVEVELSVKSPQRLEQTCRRWARDREVAGVIYFAPGHVRGPLTRAAARARAQEQIILIDL